MSQRILLGEDMRKQHSSVNVALLPTIAIIAEIQKDRHSVDVILGSTQSPM